MRDHDFRIRRRELTQKMGSDQRFLAVSREWFAESVRHRYSYNFDWLGLPAIQYPQDTVFLQELIWSSKPDLIIETGVARGGSLLLSASMMVLLDLEKQKVVDLANSANSARVVGVEIALSDENREAIANHMLSPYIALVDGSSTASESLDKIRQIISDNSSTNPMVILDSNHSHNHVFAELNSYSELVSVGGFIVVMDTAIEQLDSEFHDTNRWGKGDNPMTAVLQFVDENPNFTIDETLTEKLMISVAPQGVLRRTS